MPHSTPVRPAAGFTLIEMTIALSIVGLMGLGALSLTMSLSQLEAGNRQAAVATSVARDVIERMEAIEFEEIFAAFNEDSGDDPDGADTALGPAFCVIASGQAFGSVAYHRDPPAAGGGLRLDVTVSFPTDGAGMLDETAPPVFPGTPTDLDGDGTIEAGDRAADYKYLPCLIQISWRSLKRQERITVPRVFTKTVSWR